MWVRAVWGVGEGCVGCRCGLCEGGGDGYVGMSVRMRVYLHVNEGCDVAVDRLKLHIATSTPQHPPVPLSTPQHPSAPPPLSTSCPQDHMKRSVQCLELISQAKERQEAEANKNASILLQELDMEKVCTVGVCSGWVRFLCVCVCVCVYV